MIGLDTNIVLRYLLQDEPEQTAQVNHIVEDDLSPQNPGFLSLPTVLELVWVLRSVFKQDQNQIATHLERLLGAESFVIQNEQEVFEAMYALKRGTGEFEDALIGAVNRWAGCSHTYTSDRRALRLSAFQSSPDPD